MQLKIFIAWLSFTWSTLWSFSFKTFSKGQYNWQGSCLNHIFNFWLIFMFWWKLGTNLCLCVTTWRKKCNSWQKYEKSIECLPFNKFVYSLEWKRVYSHFFLFSSHVPGHLNANNDYMNANLYTCRSWLNFFLSKVLYLYRYFLTGFKFEFWISLEKKQFVKLQCTLSCSQLTSWVYSRFIGCSLSFK